MKTRPLSGNYDVVPGGAGPRTTPAGEPRSRPSARRLVSSAATDALEALAAPRRVASGAIGRATPPTPGCLGEPVDVGRYAFYSGAARARRQDFVADGQTIPVYTPRWHWLDPVYMHTPAEVAAALSALPPIIRRQVRAVELNRGRNPDDGYIGEVFGEAEFRSYMSCAADGIIHVFPMGEPISMAVMTASLVHEVGHAVSYTRWGRDSDGAAWQPWREAMSSDVDVPSEYGRHSAAEDFAEALRVYFEVRGTPAEAARRQSLSARFAVIDDLLAAIDDPPPAGATPPSS